MLISLSIVFASWRSEKQGKEAYQKRLVGLGVLTIIFSGILSALVLPALGIYTPNMVFIGIAFFSLLMATAIHTQGLFVLTPEMAMAQIMALIPDAIVITDGEGKITSVNGAAAGILGISGGDLSGQNIGNIIGGKQGADLMDTIFRQGRVIDKEAEIDGTRIRFISVSGVRVNNPEGEPAGVVLVIRDITERKAKESALRIANEKISLLTSLTRHDISNLVMVLSGYLELMGEDCERYLKPAIKTVQKISAYLQFSRQYQDIGSTQPQWQLLPQIVTRAIGEVHPEGLEVSANVPDVEIFADGLFYRVIYALIDNTIRHAGSATRICIRAEKGEDNTLTIVFEDNGRGIEEKDKELIFEYGYGNHTGLGLAISRDILALTGLSIRETGVPGRGARFEILVPPQAWKTR
ncbi:MAG: PAS domain S-box protein [Methanolinea sp.]|nr:PAS domain S-box protein [Methanolinea sp.]